MKKLLSLFLAAILIVSSMLAVSAATDEQNRKEQLCLDKFTEHLKTNPHYYPDDNLPVSIEFIGEINGYYACYGKYGVVQTWELSYNLDGYLFETSNEYAYIDGEIKLPILFINENECLSFTEAYNKGIFTADTIAKLIYSGNQVSRLVSAFRIGDVDKNGVINISDATEIQKYLVNSGNFYNFNTKLADINNDGETTIFDATAIQKFSVNLITNFG